MPAIPMEAFGFGFAFAAFALALPALPTFAVVALVTLLALLLAEFLPDIMLRFSTILSTACFESSPFLATEDGVVLPDDSDLATEDGVVLRTAGIMEGSSRTPPN